MVTTKEKKTSTLNGNSLSFYLESDTPVFITDTEGALFRVNDAFCKTLGVAKKSVLGLSLEETGFLTKETRKQLKHPQISKLIGRETPFYFLEVRTKKGEVLSFDIEVRPFLKNEERVGEISIVRNVTVVEKKRRKREVKTEEFADAKELFPVVKESKKEEKFFEEDEQTKRFETEVQKVKLQRASTVTQQEQTIEAPLLVPQVSQGKQEPSLGVSRRKYFRSLTRTKVTKNKLGILAVGCVIIIIVGSINSSFLYGTQYLTTKPGYSFSIGAPAAWWDCNWSYCKKITIDHTKVEATLTNYPVFLYEASDADLAAYAQDDGDDIVFINQNNASQYCHQLEAFNGDTGALTAWVKVTTVYSDIDTILYMYYGNPDCSSQQNVTSSWDSSFELVAHLNETSGTVWDSTSNNNDGTCSGGVNQSATGKIDGADWFDGTDDYIDFGTSTSLNITTAITLEAWAKDPPVQKPATQKTIVTITDKHNERLCLPLSNHFTVQRTITSKPSATAIFVVLYSPGIVIQEMKTTEDSVLSGWYTAEHPTSPQEDEIEQIRHTLPDTVKQLCTIAYSKPFPVDKNTLITIQFQRNQETTLFSHGKISYLVITTDGAYDVECTTHWWDAIPVAEGWDPLKFLQDFFQSLFSSPQPSGLNYTNNSDMEDFDTVTIVNKRHEELQIVPGTRFYVERTLDGPRNTNVTLVPLFSDSLTFEKIEVLESTEENGMITQFYSSEKDSIVGDSRISVSALCDVNTIRNEKERKITQFIGELPSDIQELNKFVYVDSLKLQSPRTVRLWFRAPSWEEIHSGSKNASGCISYLVFSPDRDGFDFEGSSWWNANWLNRKLVTINSALVDANLINFPILVNVTDTNLASTAQDDGDDIAFVLYSDNSTKLNHEIELFNGATGKLVAWVNITSLSSVTDTKIWMYYGNSGCSSQQNPTGVWNSNYLAVWHMNLSTNTVYDSTSNNNDGTNDGCEQMELSLGGYALDFVEANTDYVNMGAMNSIEGKTYVTFEIIFRCDGTNSDDMLIGRSNTDYAPLIWRDETASTSGRTNTMSFVVSTGTRLELATNSVSDTNWHYFTGVFTGNTNQIRGYKDGLEDANSPVGGQVATFPSTTADFWLGAWGNGYWHEGKITEVRVSDTVRNASWISTTYNTIYSAITFITLGEEEYPAPEQSSPSPSNAATNIGVPPASFNITINDSNGNIMNITWRTNATGSWTTFNTTTGGGTGVGNGTYNVTNTSWVTTSSNKYWWSVNLTNGYAWTNETYNFTTSIPPVISNPTPNNGSTSATTPICQVQVSDQNGGTATVRFYENTTGGWVLQQINSSVDVTSPTNIEWDDYNNATLFDTKYWWKVNASDGKGCYDEEIYYFTTSSDNPPTLINENPAHGSTGVSIALATINVTIVDDEGDTMDWTIVTSPDIGDDSGIDANNGSISCVVAGLSANTTYTWYVNVTDGVIWTNETYTFTTNYQPTITLVDPSPNGSSNQDLSAICTIKPDDNDGDLLNVTWATNASGLWVNKHTNTSISPNNNVSYQFTEFDNYFTTYYWKVFVDDGFYNISRWYYFSTEAIQTSIDTIVPYNETSSPLSITASGPSVLDNVTLWYRYSLDNYSWWWNDNWTYCRTITIDHTDIDTSLVNFPVLVVINSTIGTKCDNGDSIRFIDLDGLTEYYYEIEEWNGAGDSYVWVNVTYLSSTQDTIFLMYYNNSDAIDNQNPTYVWDSNYEMVQHMIDDTTSTILDSTSNNHDGTKGGANNPAETTGKISKGQDFSSDQISCGDLTPITAYTAECWIKADSLGGAGDLGTYGNTIMASATNGLGYPLWLSVGKGGATEVTFRAFTANVAGSDTSGANLNTVDKFYIVATATISSTAKVYVNSVERLSFTAESTSFTNIFTIGDLRPTRAIYFDGMIDEVRLSNTIRNTSWINASYQNQNSVTTFLTIDGEQSGRGWREWNNASNPDTSTPWEWNFDFPNGTGYYEFYSLGKKEGSPNETAPSSADGICYFEWLPVVLTNTSTGVEETNATLQGYLSDGGMSCTVRFEYGPTTSYGTNTTNQTINQDEEFSENISGLTPGQLYRYRTYAENTNGVDVGNDSAFLTKPSSPTNFSAQNNNSTTMYLNWTTGTGANLTYIEYNTSAAWTRGEGTVLYNDSGTQYEHTGLTEGTTYYYQAWSYTNWTYNPTIHEWSEDDENATTSNTTNNAPTISLRYPSPNGTSDVEILPTCSIWANDTDGQNLDVYWYENTTGSWVLRNTNASISANSTVNYAFTQFDTLATAYWWKISINDTQDNVTAVYHFKTLIETSVDTISPYEIIDTPLTMNATGPADLDNVTLWYRYSYDNFTWWNAFWSERKIVYFNASSSQIPANYTVLLNITHEADMNNNFSDLRFIRYTNSTMQLDYWIENKSDGNWAKVWVELQDNITTTSQPLAWMYFGNTNASTASNGTNTFPFFDDFPGASLDSKWSVSASSYSVSSSILRINVGAVGLQNALSFNLNDGYIVEGKILYNTNVGGYSGTLSGQSSRYTASGNGGLAATSLYMRNSGSRTVHRWTGTGSAAAYNCGNSDVFTSVDNVWYILGAKFDSAGVVLWRNRTSQWSYGCGWVKNINYISLGDFSGAAATNIQDTSYDWVLIREYQSTEPTYTLQSESDWMEWENASNPDDNTPWQWDFDFPNGTGYYEFYSIGKKEGFTDETPPPSADAICYYNLWTNTPPTIEVISPANGSIDIEFQPACSVWANDTDGQNLTVYWYENTSGSWVLRNINNTVTANSTVSYSFTEHTNYGIEYYWKVAVNDSIDNISAIYHFTTEPINTSVDTIIPFWVTSSPLTINATAEHDNYDNVTLWYRYSPTNFSWWNTSWSYRKPINLTVSAGSTSSNHQVLLNITYREGMNSNFSDLRFVNYSTNNTLYDYWVESKRDGTWCNVWVEIGTPITTTNRTLAWMYYGNPSASTASSGTNTFVFFDDFNSFDASKWTATGGYSVSSGNLTITTGSVYTDNTISSQSGLISEAKVKWNNFAGYSGLEIASTQTTYGSNNPARKIVYLMTNSGGSSSVTAWAGTGTVTGYNIVSGAAQFAATAGTTYKIGHAVTATNVIFYKDRTQTNSYAGTWSGTFYLWLGYFNGAGAGGTDISDIVADWVIVRKYSSSTPTYYIGDEIWTEWNDAGNPDEDSPWQWNFNFPNGTGYYQFYSLGKKSESVDETAFSFADAQCKFNNMPTISNEIPINGSIDIEYPPSLNITINDDNGDSMTVSWYSNSSGSWQVFGSNTSVGNGTYHQLNNNFSEHSTMYWWYVTVSDELDTNSSAIFHFTTSSGPPNVTTNATTGVEETNATLWGYLLDDGGENCTVRFQYGTTTNYGTNTTNQTKSNSQTFSSEINSLIKGQLYYYRTYANNSAGSDTGNNLTFLTKPDPPSSLTVQTNSSSVIYLTWVAGDGANNTYIERSTNSVWARGVGTEIYNNTGTWYEDTGRSENTTYYYQAWSYTSWGNLHQWSDTNDSASNVTNALPTITDERPANESTDVSITPVMNITVRDYNDGSLTVRWYSNSSGSWQQFGMNSSVGNGTYHQTNSNFSVYETTYWWNASVSDGIDVNESDVFWFTTEYGPPTVITNASTGVEEGNATVWGFLEEDGNQSCTVRFEYGTTTNYGTNTSNQSKGEGETFSADITGLNPGQLYHYRAYANNTGDSDTGDDMTFLTKPNAPVSFTATAYNTTQINLSWVKGTGANNTYIEWNTTENWTRGQGTMIYNDTGTSYSHTSLTPGVTYYYRAWSYTTWTYTSTIHQWSDDETNASANATTQSNAAPQLSDENPTNESTNVNLNSALSIQINDNGGDTMNITWYWGTDSSCPNYIGSNSSISNGTYRMSNDNNFSAYSTIYYWKVVANDGMGGWTNETYHFTTRGANKLILTKNQSAYSLEMNPSGTTLYGYVKDTNVTSSIDTSWHHVAITYDGDTLRLYKDGVLVNSTALSGAIPTTTDHLFAGQYLSGTLDELRISSTARSAAWINTTYINTNDPATFATFGSQVGVLSTWTFRKKITISSSMVDTNLPNLPVLIFNASDTDLQSHALSSGNDIIFMSSSVDWTTGTWRSKLDHEIEYYTSGTGKLVAWVRIPLLYGAVDTEIYMYYGSTLCTTNRENPAGVWDSNFHGVWHLNQSSGTLADSTSYGNDGTAVNDPTFNATGKIAGAMTFDGSDDYVDCSDPADGSLDFGVGDFTLECWVKTGEDEDSSILSKINISDVNGEGYALTFENGGAVMNASLFDGTQHYLSPGSTSINDGVWHYLVVTFDRDGNGVFYVDGETDGSTDISGWNGDINTSESFEFCREYLSEKYVYFDGTIDETRISDIVRNASWVNTTFNNMNDTGGFLSFGLQKTRNVAPTQSTPNPNDETTGQSLNPTLSILVNDTNVDEMDMTFRTNASGSWANIGSNNSVSNGTYRQTPTTMTSYNTTYYWSVNLTDGELWTNETYSFTTLLNATFYSSSSDGNVSQSDAIYLTAHDATSGNVDDTSTSLWIGQHWNATENKYYVYRGYVFFDTSSLPDGATIVSVTLSLYGSQDLSTNAEFNLIIQNGQPDSPHNPLNEYDYYYDNYTGSGGYLSTTSFITTGYNNITMNATGLGWINKTAATKLCIRSSRDISSTTPGPPMVMDRNEYVVVYAQDGGASYIPKLHITYTT